MSKPTHLLIPIEVLKQRISFMEEAVSAHSEQGDSKAADEWLKAKQQMESFMDRQKQISLSEEDIEYKAEGAYLDGTSGNDMRRCVLGWYFRE